MKKLNKIQFKKNKYYINNAWVRIDNSIIAYTH